MKFQFSHSKDNATATLFERHVYLSKNSVKMALLINGGNSHIDKICARLPIKPIETSDLLQTARDTSELKHSKVFSSMQSVSHNEIAVKTTSKHNNLRRTT